MRPLILALAALALALAAPRADAAVADRYIPFHDAADGVTTGTDSRGRSFMRFGARWRVLRELGRAQRAGGVLRGPDREDGAPPVSGGYAVLGLPAPEAARSRLRRRPRRGQ